MGDFDVLISIGDRDRSELVLFFCMTLMGKLYLFSVLFIMNKKVAI